MERSILDVEQTRQMFMFVARAMVDEKDHLTRLDQAIGDADHGIGIARGFEAVVKDFREAAFDSIGAALKKVGTVLMMSIGGASGAIFGTFFRGGAVNLMDADRFDGHALALLLNDGCSAVKQRGGARAGNKTMLDALIPAASRSTELAEAPLHEALIGVSDAAREGMENTKNMLAATGKAKTLGQRAVGHIDPGAATTYLILKHMLTFTTMIESQKGESAPE